MLDMGADGFGDARAAIAALFGAAVAVAVTDPRGPNPAPIGSEADHLSRALPKRQGEFAAGRAAARQALGMLGHPAAPIPAGEDRAPVWPKGITGSISHGGTLCAAALADQPDLIGLDIEPDTPLNAGLLDRICTPEEAAAIAGPDQLALAKLIFSAKEAAYKAQYPLSRTIFGFDHMAVTLDLPNGTFTARFLKPVAPFAADDTLPGRFTRVAGHLVTAVHSPQGAAQGG